jgi:protein-L-isoaspartate(D-aspartate) O-methyltransferase
MTATPSWRGDRAVTSSTSMPTVMAVMLHALDLPAALDRRNGSGMRVLEIGTGTGYNAALLCYRVRADNVVSVELDPTLADAARPALASLELHPRVHTGDGAAGLVTAAPFDRIIVTASTDHIPPAWISQLAPGGVILVDLRGSLTGSLLQLTMTDSDVVEGSFLNLPGAFMPMRTRLDSPHRDGESWGRASTSATRNGERLPSTPAWWRTTPRCSSRRNSTSPAGPWARTSSGPWPSRQPAKDGLRRPSR